MLVGVVEIEGFMNIEIRKCELNNDNINVVIALSEKWEKENLTYGYCANDENDIQGNDLFLAYLNKEAVGYLFGKCLVVEETITPIDKGVKCFEIEEIYVDKKYRSQNIGQRLFEYIENYYKNKVDYITLSTATKNYKSILHFYIDKMDMTFWSAKLFKRI